MDPKEIDLALDELETRLDRLRSLYEQYFLGIEKIEPQVARKDVDRRFWLLRKVHIRNTARRFRMQVLLQRYNTFQQHWARICREIENGTYVRHLLKVKKNLGVEPKTWAAKRRLGLLRRGPDGKLPTEAEGEAGEGTDVNDARDPHAPPASKGEFDAGDPFHAIERSLSYDAEEDEEGALETRRPPPPAGGARATRVEIPAFAKQPPVRSLEDLDLLDLDLDDGPPPPRAPAARVPTPAARVPTPAVTPQHPSTRPPVPRPASVRPPAPVAPRAPLAPRQPAPPTQPVAAQPVRPAPAPATATTTATAGGPRAARAPAASPASPFAANGPGGPFAPRPATSPRPAATEGPAAPRPGAPNGQAGALAPPKSGGLSDERVRQLHAELVATKQKLNQPNNISVDSLAKSLRETESKLRAQHQGRSIDFNVVLKDGKPVVKPLVRK